MKTYIRFFRLYFILTILFFVITVDVNSQQQSKSGFWSGWSLNANAGLSLFYGDIENYEFYKAFENNNEYRFGFGGMLGKQLSPLFSLRGQLFYGDLSGTKRKANKWFEGDVFESSLSTTLDLTNLFLGKKDRLLGVYAMVGIGLAQWRTSLMVHPTNEAIRENGYKGGSGFDERTVEAVIPFGLGLDFRLSDHWNIIVEGTLRPVNSDLLDANEGGFQFDFYSYNFVGITYNFGGKKTMEPVMPPKVIAVREEDEFVEEPVEEVIITEEIIAEPEEIVIIEEKKDEHLELEEKLLDADSETGMYETPWPGVTFTVQIAASKKRVPTTTMADKFDLSGIVNLNQGDGWYRYSIGNYVKYWRAREYRNILATRNSIDDAFVVAYKNGERLTLSQLVNYNFNADEKDLIVEKIRPAESQTFSIQIMATRNGSISSTSIREMYGVDAEVYKEHLNGWYKYCVGNFESYQEAAKLRNKLKIRGVKDAFIVEYIHGRRK